ncbi:MULTISPECIES: hypothetical protein [Paenibacillus]|uniref:hypothetical protein n=1 Tax=Paenibacillus TaxID=44249 RepID=UPI000737B0FF|nr:MULTISPECIES: hypothetical protein [Paenibacillus]
MLAQLQEKIFNDQAIPVLAKQLNEYQNSKQTSVKADQQRLSKSLEGVDRQIENIVNAVASGLNNPTILEKLGALEEQKVELETKLLKAQQVKEKAAITEELCDNCFLVFRTTSPAGTFLRSRSSSAAM